MKLQYRLHGVRFSIEAPCSTGPAIADFVMPDCIAGHPSGRPHGIFEVRRDECGLALCRDGRPRWHARDTEELVPWLEGEIVRWLLGRLIAYAQVHAAVVERDGRAILLAGGPDSGKTSLACAFGRAGWTVMSDEVALIDTEGQEVLAFPRMMFVEDGTARLLPELAGHPRRSIPVEGGTKMVRAVRPGAFGTNRRDRASIRALVFIQRGPSPNCDRLSDRNAMERLLEHSFDAAERPRLNLDACISVARSAPAWQMTIGPLEGAVEFILGRIEEAP